MCHTLSLTLETAQCKEIEALAFMLTFWWENKAIFLKSKQINVKCYGKKNQVRGWECYSRCISWESVSDEETSKQRSI